MAPIEGLAVSDEHNEMQLVAGGLLDAIGSGDIRRRRLSGRAQPGQTFHRNLVECRLEEVEFERIDFSRCDWKDCRVDQAVFIDCDLGHASMITNSYQDCRFIRCQFPDTGISDCSFAECVFDTCDFTSIIVKTSRFTNCRFLDCQTSNRIIESSLLLGTRWTGMRLELALIIGNFGLRQSDLEDCRIVRKINLPDDEAEPSQSSLSASADFSPIERFRLSYFQTETVDGDPDAMEAALDLRNWGGDAVVQASFGAQLSSFSQFLLSLYALNQMPIYPILLLHTRNFEFLEWLAARADPLPLYQTVAGIHLTLTREVDAFVVQLSNAADRLASTDVVHFAAEGPLDEIYFQAWFVAQGLEGVSVISVRPRNSPVDLAVVFTDHSALVGTLAIFLACRTKVELSQLPDQSLSAARRGRSRAVTVASEQSLFAFSAGFSSTRPAEYEINVRTLLPRSLLLDLKLSVSVAVFRRVRGVLVDLLTKDGTSGDGKQPGTHPR